MCSDLIRHEVFHRLDEAGEAVKVAVPGDDVDILFAYSTGKGPRITASRVGGIYVNCKKIDEYTVAVFLPLSSSPIGTGRMIRTVSLIVPSDSFPSGRFKICVPAKSNVELWVGPTDTDGPSVDTCIIPDLQELPL